MTSVPSIAAGEDEIVVRIRTLRDETAERRQDMLAYLLDLALLEAERHGTLGPRPDGPVELVRPRNSQDA